MPFERKITTSSIANTNLNDYWLDKFPGQNSLNGLLSYIYNYKAKLFEDPEVYRMLKNTEKVRMFSKQKSHLLRLFGFKVGSNGEIPFDTWQAMGEVPILRKLIMDAVTSWDNIKDFMKYWKITSYTSLVEPCLLYTSPSPRDS